MSMFLDADAEIGTLSYNGFNFPPAKKSKVRFEPQMDPSGRVVEYLTTTIAVEFIVTTEMVGTLYTANSLTEATERNQVASNLNALVEHICRTITMPQRQLDFSLSGVGEAFSVQTAEGGIDMKFGPLPKLVEVQFIASNRAALISWEIVAHIPRCPDVLIKQGTPYSLSYTLEWEVNERGFVTRTIEGEVKVALSAFIDGTRFSPTTAERQWEYLYHRLFRKPSSFRRKHTRKLSEDRTTLSFTIIDQQAESSVAFFPGTDTMDLKVKGSSGLADSAFSVWAISVVGRITLLPGVPLIVGWMAYMDVFRRVFLNSTDGYFGSDSEGEKSHAILTKMSFEYDIHGFDLAFAYDYTLYCNKINLLSALGYFNNRNQSESLRGPLPPSMFPKTLAGDNWAAWSLAHDKVIDSVGARNPDSASGKQSPEGFYFLPGDEAIIDVCGSQLPTTTGSPSELPPNLAVKKLIESPTYEIRSSGGWVAFETGLKVTRHNNTVYSTPLEDLGPKTDVFKRENPSQRNYIDDVDGDVAAVIPNPADDSYNSFQVATGSITQRVLARRTSKSEYEVTFTGYAIRVGFPVPEINLISVGGVPALKTGTDSVIRRNWATEQVAVVTEEAKEGKKTPESVMFVGGPHQKVKIYATTWRKTYILLGKPGNWSAKTNYSPDSVGLNN
jgi:hypothetical protein